MLDDFRRIGSEDERGFAEVNEVEGGALFFRDRFGGKIEIGEAGGGIFLVTVDFEKAVKSQEGSEILAEAFGGFFRFVVGLLVAADRGEGLEMENTPLPRGLAAPVRIFADLNDDVIAALAEDLADLGQIVFVEVAFVVGLRPERRGKSDQDRREEQQERHEPLYHDCQ